MDQFRFNKIFYCDTYSHIGLKQIKPIPISQQLKRKKRDESEVHNKVNKNTCSKAKKGKTKSNRSL
jgi:hypothetical protein